VRVLLSGLKRHILAIKLRHHINIRPTDLFGQIEGRQLRGLREIAGLCLSRIVLLILHGAWNVAGPTDVDYAQLFGNYGHLLCLTPTKLIY
jgi:hypothetical protein